MTHYVVRPYDGISLNTSIQALLNQDGKGWKFFNSEQEAWKFLGITNPDETTMEVGFIEDEKLCECCRYFVAEFIDWRWNAKTQQAYRFKVCSQCITLTDDIFWDIMDGKSIWDFAAEDLYELSPFHYVHNKALRWKFYL